LPPPLAPFTHTRTQSPRYYDPWAAYIATERSARCVREARALYRRLHGRKLEYDGQLTACADWLRFEREEGR
jgi:hypothetical protein